MPHVSETHAKSVVEAFDSIAESFEETLENDVTRRFRRQLYETIRSLAPKGASVLDISCGTGIDCVALAQEGYRTVGFDISPGMIREAKKRAQRFETDVEFGVSSFEDLSLVWSRDFDLVLSNFGGLNCVESLDRVADEIASVIRPGGYFVAVVMPPLSLWEIVAGLTRLDTKAAFRRLGQRVSATGFGSMQFQVFYHSPRSLARSCERWFDMRQFIGVNIVSPPPHAARFTRRHPVLSATLNRFDTALCSFPGFRSIGDHYVAILERRH